MLMELAFFTAILLIVVIMIIGVDRVAKRMNSPVTLAPDPYKNKYVQMDYFELDRIMSWVLANVLEQLSYAYESPNDHNAEASLIANAIPEFIAYFASSANAIELAYGSKFLTTWATIKIGILTNRKYIDRLVSQSTTAEAMYSAIVMADAGKKNQR